MVDMVDMRKAPKEATSVIEFLIIVESITLKLRPDAFGSVARPAASH
jgi:hypothetical protein